HAADLRPGGAPRLGVSAEQLLPVAAEPLPAGHLRLGGAELDEPDGRGDEDEELEEFGLPVLRDVDEERGGRDEVPESERRLTVHRKIRILLGQSCEGLPDERTEEEREEEAREAMIPDASHRHRPAIGRMIIAARPMTMIVSQAQNANRMVRPSSPRTRSAAELTQRGEQLLARVDLLVQVLSQQRHDVGRAQRLRADDEPL